MKNVRLTYPYRHVGLDHDWFRHAPTHLRPPVSWPDNKPVALWITVPVEHFPLDAPSQPFRPLGSLPLGYPDLWNASSRDYGLRLGIYRLMNVLDRLDLRATAPINASIVNSYPRLVDEIAIRQWEFSAHGVDMGHLHHQSLERDVERKMIEEAQNTVSAAAGGPVQGWYSPDRSQSSRTFALLAELGFGYVTDWANDDMPYEVTTPSGSLYAMPLTHEWSDRHLLVQHNLNVDEYTEQVWQAFTRLAEESAQHGCGRILSLSLTPWIFGYPHRIGGLERMLTRIVESGLTWNATGIEIVDAVRIQARSTFTTLPSPSTNTR